MNARAAFATLAVLLAALAFTVLRPTPPGGPTVRDFNAYYAAGAAVRDGLDPYTTALAREESRIPQAPRDPRALLPFVSPPTTLPVWTLVSRLPYETALRVWNLVLAFSLVAIVVCTASALALPRASMLGALLLGVTFVPMTSDIALGGAALPAFAAVCIAFAGCERVTFGASLAAALGALQPNLGLPLLVAATRPRGAAMLLGGALVAYLAGAFARGWGWIAPYLAMLRAHAAAERGDVIQLTVASVGYGFGASPALASLAGWIIALGALAFAVAAMLRVDDRMQRFAIACAALPFASGFFHEHDLLVLAVPVAFCAFRARGTSAAIALVGATLVAVNWLDFAQQPYALAQNVTLGLAFVAAFAACLEERMPATYAVVLGAAGLLALGAAIGAHHPVPIWPDAMRPFALPAKLDPASLWKTEQLQTGLVRPDAAAAWLRVFSLLGCAIVFYVTSAIRYRRS